MAGTCNDALRALSERIKIPLELHEGSCEFNLGGQPFIITDDVELDRLVVSSLVADDLPASPSRDLTVELLNFGFGMMHAGLPAIGRDPETGFLAAFEVFPCSRLVAAEFPDAFMKFVTFAVQLAERLDKDRDAAPAAALEPSAGSTAPDPSMIRV